jgi:hypothetical protein
MRARVEGSLAALQAQMSGALLAATPTAQLLPEAWFAGAQPGAVGLRVHRNTVLGALANALRLSHPAVDRLVGEAFFDSMAVGYARAVPPRAPQLDVYGEGLSAWIAGFPGTEAMPYIGELARFEWALSELARVCVAPDGGPVLRLEGGARLRLAAPMRAFEASYPVDALRTSILADDVAAIEALDLSKPRAHHYALWRVPDGVSVRALSAPSARFLAAALAGGTGDSALAAAADGSGEAAASQLGQVLAREILPAGFVRVETG